MNNIKIIKVNNINQDVDRNKIITLYKSTFSFAERIPLMIVKKRVKEKKYILSKYFSDNTFIGISIIFNYKTYTLIHYIVINPNLRGKGYGSCILNSIKQEYPNNAIILNSEYFSKDDKDELKRKRITFYQNNGFIINDFIVNEYGVDYYILSNKKINKEEYRNLISNCFNKLLRKLFIRIFN